MAAGEECLGLFGMGSKAHEVVGLFRDQARHSLTIYGIEAMVGGQPQSLVIGAVEGEAVNVGLLAQLLEADTTRLSGTARQQGQQHGH